MLSELLRYQLYQSDQSRVPLADELVYLEAFLAMEIIRKKDMQVSFVVEGDTRDKWIAPLMLITFIENAVKHGISAAGEGWIAIKVRVDGDLLDLEVENSLNPEAATHSPGIGLQNLQRRLALSYPDTHKIRAETQRDRYLATLSLELDR